MTELDAADESDTAPAETVRPSNVTPLFPDEAQYLRMLEALLFAAAEPLSAEALRRKASPGRRCRSALGGSSRAL